MTYQSDLLEAADDLYTLAGVPAVFTDRDLSTSTVTAIVEYDLQQFGEVADISGMTATISVRVSEMTLAPRSRTTFFVNGEDYTVDSTLLSDEIEHRVLVA